MRAVQVSYRLSILLSISISFILYLFFLMIIRPLKSTLFSYTTLFRSKLMDELAQCYNVLPQLDINNTIDHRPEGDEKWFLENEKTVTQFCRKLAAERPLKDIRDEYNYPKK